MSNLQAVADGLLLAGFPKPSPHWLTTLLPSSRVTPPAQALLATAKLRLLSLDLTTPGLFDPSALSLPPNTSDPGVKARTLAQPVLLQVLEVEDMSRSRWEQIEAIEAQERGEKTRGREIVRDVPAEEGENGERAGAGGRAGMRGGPHKLVLQDWRGQRVFGMELAEVPRVELGMCVGSKILLRGAAVARGVVLLEPRTAVVLGGKIVELHEVWVRDRKKILKEAMESAG